MCQKEEEASKLGLHWSKVEDKDLREGRPKEGTEVGAPEALASALAAGQTSFERAELDGFGVTITWNSVVRAGGAWYRPAARTPVEDGLFRHALSSLDVRAARRAAAARAATPHV